MWLLLVIIPLLIWLDLRLFKIYFNFFFEDSDDFSESVKYSLIPDIFSLFSGEYIKDRLAEFKLGMFIFLCIITIILEVYMVKGLLSLF